MPLNVPGILVVFQLLIRPRIVVPSLVVKDIRQLDFPALKRAGYRGAVFDKDNCLTLPHRDTLVPELEEAWKTCRETFGEGNVLIVSNSAGTKLDAGGIQAESVQHHLKVPVLFHRSFKPAYKCIANIRSYFFSLRSPISPNELIIVGDRIFTDIVMANRLQIQSNGQNNSFTYRSQLPRDDKEKQKMSEDDSLPAAPQGPLGIYTTGVWKRESMFMRWMEKLLVSLVQMRTTPSNGEPLKTDIFMKENPQPESPKRAGGFQELFSLFRRI